MRFIKLKDKISRGGLQSPRKRSSYGLAVACIAALCCSPANAVDYDVYLMAGQSNADGRGKVSELRGSLAQYNIEQTDVSINYANPRITGFSTGWINLQPGLAHRTTVPTPYFGMELSFGRAMADNSPGRRVAIIKYALGGTNLAEDWDPKGSNNPQWDDFTAHVSSSLASLSGRRNTVNVRGMIWHQGESDAGNRTFKRDLEEFLKEVRNFVGNPQLPIVIGHLERHTTSPERSRKYQNDIFWEVRNSDPFTGLASSFRLTTSDRTHFDSSSLIKFGERYADKMIGLRDAGGPPNGWSKLKAKHSGKCINVTGASERSLANMDQFTCSDAPHRQFEFKQISGDYYEIKIRRSGMCVDVEGASNARGANIVQWPCTGGENQQFKFTNMGNNYYQIEAKHSQLCLDIEGASMANGANLGQWSCSTNSDNQLFMFD